MPRNKWLNLWVISCWLIASLPVVEARPSLGRGGGGGGRPSMGGGGGRPSMGGGVRPSGGFNRPSMGGRNLPSVSRPPQVNRPSVNTRPATRPSVGTGGNLGQRPNPGARPGLGNVQTRPKLPSTDRPTTLPSRPGGIGNRPSIKPPTNLPATKLPERPLIKPPTDGRPGFPGYPGGGNRPNLNLPNRPGNPGRPVTLPGNTRPGLERPDRPVTLPSKPKPGMPRPERPIVGGQRPGFQNRPGINNRPIVNRPIIGGGNVVNRPGGNININRPNVNIHRPIIGNPVNNRPGWGIDPGFNRPHWGNDWHNNYVRPHHHGWYHGCWHGHWHNYWYVPLAVGATAWTLNAFTSSWGYGPTYYNPYYIEPAASVVAPYDYSQPIVVNNYTSTGEGAGEVPAAESPQSQAVLATFDEALAFFKNGEYTRALAKVTVALQKDSTDPVMHEFRALCLFAQGEYKQSAAALNSLLAVAPGMDWTTVSGLYGNVDDYSKQLRRLEDHCEKQTKDSAAFFVLAYHYLVLGHTDDAIKTLQTVVQLQPKDATAQRMLAGLSPPKEEEPDKPQPKDAQPEEPQTDLVGAWKSSAGSTTIELTISEDSTFTWKASTPGQTAKEVKGSVNIAADILSLETEKDGAMVGTVKSGGADRFTFRMQGTLPSDPALTFARMK